VQQGLDPVIADVVESFCVVELFLPDYLGHALPWSRLSRAYTWFCANWGYEESKPSLALAYLPQVLALSLPVLSSKQ
jgi:acyl-[acyl-carrier protein] desaturase